jgi:hypothetical protein
MGHLKFLIGSFDCLAHPSADVLISKDGKIKAMFLPKNTTALIQTIDQGILLHITEYLKTLTVFGLAWQKITPTIIPNCWKYVWKR